MFPRASYLACLLVGFLTALFFGAFVCSGNDCGFLSQDLVSGGSTVAAASSPPLREMNHFRAVFVTVPNIEVAKKIAS